MIKIIKERGQGRTTELIKISTEKQIPILVANEMQIPLILEKASAMNVSIPRPITAHDLMGKARRLVLIDELDTVTAQILKEYLGITVNGYSLTKPKQIKKAEIAEKFNTTIGEMEIID